MEESRKPIAKRRKRRTIALALALTAVAICAGLLVLVTGDNRAADWFWSHASRPRVIAHLVDNYFSRDPKRSHDAQVAILALRDEQDIYALIRQAAKHGHAGDALDRLCRVIGRIGEPAALPLYKTRVAAYYEDRPLWIGVRSVPGWLQGPVVSLLIRPKSARVETLSYVAEQALYNMGKPAIHPLLPFIGASGGIDRGFALNVLGTMNDPEAVRPIIALVNSSTGQIKSDALETLVKQRSPLAVDTLMAVLTQSQGSHARTSGDAAMAAIGLGRLRDTRALPWLIDIMANSRSTEYRETAANLLGDYRTPEAEAALIKMLRNRGSFGDDVIMLAASALLKIGTPAARKAISDAGLGKLPEKGDE